MPPSKSLINSAKRTSGIIKKDWGKLISNKHCFEYFLKGNRPTAMAPIKTRMHNEESTDDNFFTVVLLIYSLVNIYIFIKGYMPFFPSEVTGYCTCNLRRSGRTFIAGKFLESRHSTAFSDNSEYCRRILVGFHAVRISFSFSF